MTNLARSPIYLLLACLLWSFPAASLLVAEEAPRRPNLLLILVDDLGREWVSCYGSQSIETPTIDKLAAGGMKFENFYSMPQCTPTRVSLLTGQYPFRHGWVNHWDVPCWGSGCHFDPERNMSFARLLKKQGYKTAAAGKWQINDFRVQPRAMERHGFDQWCMWTGHETRNPPSAERYWDAHINTPEGSKTHEGRFGPDVFTDFLIEFMREHRDEPMLLYYPMVLTHTPLTTTPLARDAEGPLVRHKAMVTYVEHCLERLLKELDALGLRDDTIIVFTTDNGTGGRVAGKIDGHTVRGAKAQTNEAGARMPFIVNGPGRVPAGVVTDELADITDILPTFVELAGGELPEKLEVDGHSLAPLWLGQTERGPRQWILSMGHGAAAFEDGRVRGTHDYFARVVRNKRWKLHVAGGESAQPAALYDLKNDPWERNNLFESDEPQAAAAREALVAVIESLPEEDARPNYEPLPPQPWDKHQGWAKPNP